MNNQKEQKIVSIIKLKGPCLPVHIAKEMNMTILLTSAILSGVVKSGYIKATKGRIGNSQLYYVEGQEEKVLQMLYSTLNDFQKQFLEDFKKRKAIFDSDLEARERIFINNLLDFIKPVQATINDNKEIFWRYYSVSPEEGLRAITKYVPEKGKKAERENVVVPHKEEQKSFGLFTREAPNSQKEIPGEVYTKATEFFRRNNFTVLEEKLIKKNREYNFIIKNNNLIAQKYFVKAKLKKKLNDSDISLVWMKGKGKNLPVILLTNGKLTKKAEKFHKQKIGQFLKIFKF